jgi:hypothetical protein
MNLPDPSGPAPFKKKVQKNTAMCRAAMRHENRPSTGPDLLPAFLEYVLEHVP